MKKKHGLNMHSMAESLTDTKYADVVDFWKEHKKDRHLSSKKTMSTLKNSHRDRKSVV